MERIISVFGIFFIIGICYLFSNNRKAIKWRVVFWGLGLQLSFALIILRTAPGKWIFEIATKGVNKLLSFSDQGAAFLFGNLYNSSSQIAEKIGQSTHYQFIDAGTKQFVDIGLIFAIHILPTIIFFGSFMAILYHFGIMQKIVESISKIMVKTMKISGAESLSAASNIFVGQTEAPMVIKPFLDKMTTSEIMTIMTGGFATIAGGVMAAYIKFGVEAGHLMAASVMSAPAAILVAKILYPETEKPVTLGAAKIETPKESINFLDAATNGARDGIQLAINVGGMLIAFISLVALLNYILGMSDDLLNLITFNYFNFQFDLSLQNIFQIIFTPFAFFMGVPFHDIPELASVLGTKIAVNELVAYLDLVTLKSSITPRAFTIGTYAICGFANFSSVAIQVGGIGAVAPGRRHVLAKIGLKAMFGGAFASWLTATIAAIII